jgi:hypothetical protein
MLLLLSLAPLARREARRLAAISIAVCGGTLVLIFAPLARALGGEAALFEWMFARTDALAELAPMALLNQCGPLWLSIPIALVAFAGALAAVRGGERLLLIVAAPAVVHLVFVAMRGSVREDVLAVAPVSVALVALCVRGLSELARRTGQPLVRIGIVAAYCLVSWIWTAPLLRARLDVAPPPSKAAIWIDDHLDGGGDAVVLVSDELAPHAAALITKARLVPLGQAAGERSRARYALVSGESTEAGAIVFSWPDSAPLRLLAHSRFRVVSVVPLGPASGPQ